MKNIKKIIACLMTVLLCAGGGVTAVYAQETWPDMPHVEAPSMCLIEVSTGTILYERNMDEQNYPASITKVMTALLAVENCALDEVVTFSEEAVYGNEGDTSHIWRDIGEKMTMEECLYGMMLESANECAWAIGEHVGGTMKNFTKMMNARAKELGCTNTHFNNPNGLPDEEHRTSAHDMALIAAEAYRNETVRVIMGTKSYTIPPTNKHDEQTLLHNHHKMVYPYHGDYEHIYEYAAGGKTGYTNAAGNTLVSYAQKGDMALACVVMREKSPYHYTDTRELFDYCFENFKVLHPSQYEESGASDDETVFAVMDEDAAVLLPASADFSELTAKTSYERADDHVLGTICYFYGDREVGSADIYMNDVSTQGFVFSEMVNEDAADDEPETQKEVSEKAAEEDQTQDVAVKSDSGSIHIEISPKGIAVGIGMVVLLALCVLFLYWLGTHSYLIRQKIAGMRSRRSERNRYRTIHDTRKSRRRNRGKRVKKSKHLRF